MIQWQYQLNGVEIEEPIGFSEIVFQSLRDDIWHGIFFEAATSQLSFYGAAFDILQSAKQTSGVDAEVIFTADSKCEGETEYTNVITGKLDFSNYQETCGDQCLVRLSVEQDTCAMVFKNRFDQKVNIDSMVAFDKATNLTNYPGIRFQMPLATQVIPIAADAEVSLDNDVWSIGTTTLYAPDNQNLLIRPTYQRVNDNSIATAQLDDPFNVFQDPDNFFVLSPQVLLEEPPSCINQDFVYEVRLKGTITINALSFTGSNLITLMSSVDIWDGVGSHTGPCGAIVGVCIDNGDATVLHRDILVSGMVNGTYDFDISYSGTTDLNEGEGIYAYIKMNNANTLSFDNNIELEIDVVWAPETSFLLSNDRSCPQTDADVYLINETLAHATEAITDNCLTVKSDYYGRLDSQPFASDERGCGGFRVVTPGLRIRQAPDKEFFASMKELMEGLWGIDNIGMGMATFGMRDVVRIEPVGYFYQDVEILNFPFIPRSVSDIEATMIYSNIKYGYNKWEIKSTKGIDEFNSYKEARTGIKSINNELDITSNLITSGYVIENLRTTTLINSGQTDNTYDNDIFLICVDLVPGLYIVEQGIAENAANFYSPATAYNWRVRPISNLMRWFKSIANCYVNLANTTSKIFFTSGKGNYLAEGELSDSDPCKIENKVMAENDDIAITDFQDILEGTPYFKAETVTFEYPLSIRDYKTIKTNPYGYITVQCGTSTPYKAFIKSVLYKPAAGTAEFILIKSWR